MKKLLLLSLFTFGIASQAQLLVNEPCTTLTIGNVGTDLTGVTLGQGDWTTFVATTASPAGQNSDFQVVNKGGSYGNAFQITGSTSATGTRWMTKNLATQWGSRTAGNDIAEVEFDFFTGPVSTSKNTMRMVFYESSARLKMLAGLMVTMDTKEIRGLSYLDPTTLGGTGAIGNYSLTLGGTVAAPAVLILLPDTWYHLGLSYNFATGEAKFKENTLLLDRTFLSAAILENVGELDILCGAGTANAAASIAAFDNIDARASSTNTLGITTNVTNANAISVYPNPASTNVTITGNDLSLTSIEMTDMNGRIVKTQNFEGVNESQISISDLAQGVYLMKIISNQGTVTKKLLKQ